VLAGGSPGKINSFHLTKFPGKKELRGFAPPAIARHERAGPIGIME